MNNPVFAYDGYLTDPDSFSHLYQEYQGFVYRRAYSMLGDRTAAEDVTQNTFIQVYRNLARFRGGIFQVWLFRIVTNACYDELRRRKRLAHLQPISIDVQNGDYSQLENLVAPGLSAEEKIEQVELSAIIRRCLDGLPQLYRAPLVLVDVLEMDYSAAASHLGIPVGTLKSRLWRARTLLRALLEHNSEDYGGSYAHFRRARL